MVPSMAPSAWLRATPDGALDIVGADAASADVAIASNTAAVVPAAQPTSSRPMTASMPRRGGLPTAGTQHGAHQDPRVHVPCVDTAYRSPQERNNVGRP